MNKTLGTCSRCGGAVRIPIVWMGVNPPKATCGSCGATAKNAYGDVIQMEVEENNLYVNTPTSVMTDDLLDKYEN